jgi:hypothetical protein
MKVIGKSGVTVTAGTGAAGDKGFPPDHHSSLIEAGRTENKKPLTRNDPDQRLRVACD